MKKPNHSRRAGPGRRERDRNAASWRLEQLEQDPDALRWRQIRKLL